MARTIVVTSGKGGVGKTTTSANIGTALALQDKKVCLMDMDIGLRNLDVILGLENRIIYDIVDVAEGRVKLHQALIKDKRFNDHLFLIPAAQHADKDAVSEEQMLEIVKELDPLFDFIIIDCPAGIEQGFKNAVVAADEAIIVTTPENSAIRDADRIVGLLEQNELAAPQLIINRVKPQMMLNGDIMDVEEITQHLGIPLLGIVFDDEEVTLQSNAGVPVVMNPDLPSAKGYRNIARRILGDAVPLMSLDQQEQPSLWQKIKRIFTMQ
ncbi:septum site-determining protein MinD [Allofustis seminis]|uniref:septum site-determining protein MinD n=1 Tax=Allofustis seminis TaxID=166939 RepID=UPI000360DA32|nr:septum site-determining protein MinD [Allofustis seminis]